MKPLGIAVIGAGVLLAVCAVRNIDPRGVVFSLLTGDPMPAPGSGLTSFKTPSGKATPYEKLGTSVARKSIPGLGAIPEPKEGD